MEESRPSAKSKNTYLPMHTTCRMFIDDTEFIRIYFNLDEYEGEFVDSMRHGKGSMKYSHGDIYEGEFEKNLFHGFGVYIWNTVIDENDNVVMGRRYCFYINSKVICPAITYSIFALGTKENGKLERDTGKVYTLWELEKYTMDTF